MKGAGTVFLEFSSTGVVGTGTVDAVRTRGAGWGGNGGNPEWKQTLSMTISPSAVMKIQLFRGSPFDSTPELLSYQTVHCKELGKSEGVKMIEVGGGGGGGNVMVEFVWSEDMLSPKFGGLRKTWK